MCCFLKKSLLLAVKILGLNSWESLAARYRKEMRIRCFVHYCTFYLPNLEHVLFSREFPFVVVVIRMRNMDARKNTNSNNLAMKNNKAKTCQLIDMRVNAERNVSIQRTEIEIERMWSMKTTALPGNRCSQES